MAFAVPLIAVLVFLVAFIGTCSILRDITIIVPLLAHEIDRSATRIIFGTMLAPVFRMTRRYDQV
jgi:hypothetical protein